MSIKTLPAKDQSDRAVARQLNLCEGTVRCHFQAFIRFRMEYIVLPLSCETW